MKKKQRLWMKIVPVGETNPIHSGPVHPNATIGEFMDLEKLLNKVYDPEVFDLQYEWKDRDIVSDREALNG